MVSGTRAGAGTLNLDMPYATSVNISPVSGLVSGTVTVLLYGLDKTTSLGTLCSFDPSVGINYPIDLDIRNAGPVGRVQIIVATSTTTFFCSAR